MARQKKIKTPEEIALATERKKQRQKERSDKQYHNCDTAKLITALLGFEVSSDAFYVNYDNSRSWNFGYRHLDFASGDKFVYSRIRNSKFGKKPVFDRERTARRGTGIKHGNVTSSIIHPNLQVYDFDNHTNDEELSIVSQKIYAHLIHHPEMLVGYKSNFMGLHIFCTSKDIDLMNKYATDYTAAGGHVDIFNSDCKTTVGIPGYDHYIYREQDIFRFIEVLNVSTPEHLSFKKSHSAQNISYPVTEILNQRVKESDCEIPEYYQQFLERIEHKQRFINAKKRTKDWKEGKIKPALFTTNKPISRITSEIADQDIKQLEKNEGKRTQILKSSDGHKFMLRALSALNICDIEDFKDTYPNFEENHYLLISEMIEYVKTHKKTTKRTSAIKTIRNNISKIPELNKHKNNTEFMSVVEYLVYCMQKDNKQPGYVHYLGFCRMNNLPEISDRSYYRYFNKCNELGLLDIQYDKPVVIGKACRTIKKGILYLVMEYKTKVKETSKVFSIINQNKYSLYSPFPYSILYRQGIVRNICKFLEKKSLFVQRPPLICLLT